MQLLTIMLVPHAFTGNWYIAKEGVESTGPQGGVASTKETNWIQTQSRQSYVSRHHYHKLTISNTLDQRYKRRLILIIYVTKRVSLRMLTCPPIVTLLSVNAAVDSFTLSTADPRLSTRDLRIISYSTFIKGLCQHHWLLKLKLQRNMLVSLRLNWLLNPLVGLRLNWLLNPLVGLRLNWLLNPLVGLRLNWLLKPLVWLLLNWLLKPLVWLLLNWLLKPLVWLLLNWLLKPLVRLLLNWLLKPLVGLLLNWLLKPLVGLLLNWLLKPLV